MTDPFTGAAGEGEGSVDKTDPSPEPATEQAETGQDGHEDLAVIPGDEEVQLTLARAELAERTADLQRVQAEFLNYKRRVERDRDLIRENATYAALAPITEVLDTIDRAREHGDLDPGFQSVADQLERIVTGLGLTKFGAVGDAFDPAIHDALSHIGEDPEVEVTTCKVVAKSGYRIGDRVVRAAQVLVVDPVSGPSDSPAESPAEATEPAEPVEPAGDTLEDVIEKIDQE
ncbi:nucleotide exchange factor GrpE [Nocardioides dilutus]